VTFRYGMQVDPLFRDFSIRIEPGERVGLVGHSGSGKTTFVKLLHRLYDVTGGRIIVDGQDIAHVTQDSLRAQLALVPQEPILFHRSLKENIAYGRPGAKPWEIEEAARLANAHAFIERQAKGYATLVASAASSSPAASARGWRWRALSLLMLRCWCWTRRLRASIPSRRR